MYHKQANKTAIQSQHMITEALFRLLKEKPFQQITVTEICKEAAVGRKTFYRNFELREDVVAFWADQRCAEYEKDLQNVVLEQKLYYHCSFLRKHTEALITLYHNGLHAVVERKFSTFLPDMMPLWSEDPVEQAYRSQYIIAGIEAIVRMWVTRGFRETVDEIVAIIQRAQEKQIPLRHVHTCEKL